jgi:hypothetical protein
MPVCRASWPRVPAPARAATRKETAVRVTCGVVGHRASTSVFISSFT